MAYRRILMSIASGAAAAVVLLLGGETIYYGCGLIGTDKGSFDRGHLAVAITVGHVVALVVYAITGRWFPQPSEHPCCQGCGYSLTGNVSGTCPEYGEKM